MVHAGTYPDGLRVMSTNYNPQPMFNTGCQIVALNYQTMGQEMSRYTVRHWLRNYMVASHELHAGQVC